MRVLSTFSGISAASIAWKPLGWTFVGYADPGPFQSAVLHHRFGATAPKYLPEGFDEKKYVGIDGGVVPNFGDVAGITDADLEALGPVDLLEGGTPCQAWSIAGLQGGFSDPRGQMTLEFVKLALRMRRINGLKFVLWENVHNVLGHAANPLGNLLAAFSGDEHPLVPAGRKWPNAGAVYAPDAAVAWRTLEAKHFRRADGNGLLPQRRKRVFALVSFGADVDPGEVLFERDREEGPPEPGRQTQHEAGSRGDRGALDIDVYSIQQAGNISFQEGVGISKANDDMYTLMVSKPHGVIHPMFEEIVHPKVFGTMMACGAGTSRVASAGNEMDYVVVSRTPQQRYVARRIMPVEAERLQGFPDGHTDVPFLGKPVADLHRYAGCGNSMAVPVMDWLGRRIAQFTAP